MSTVFQFGRLRAGQPPARPASTGRFRIALLGNFSGRGGEPRGADALAALRPVKLDVDTLDAVIASFQPTLALPFGADGGTVTLQPRSLDDLHPDALIDALPLFARLNGLRQRLADPSRFAAAAAEVRQWADVPASDTAAPAAGAGGDDIARLLGRPASAAPSPPAPGPLDDMLRRIVAPHLLPAASPDAPALIAAVDRALTSTMRSVLQHPALRRLESAWRALDFVARRSETDELLQVVLYDIGAEEFAADLRATDRLEDTGLYRLLVEQPALDAHQGPPAALIACYQFALETADADLLGRAARIAARAQAPFIAGIGHEAIGHDGADLAPDAAEAWDALRALPAARFLALVTPRFLLRAPYGRRSSPIERFAFEEIDAVTGPATIQALPWGPPAVLAAVLLARHVIDHGSRVEPAEQLNLDDMPMGFGTDAHGDTIALPCTEHLVTERVAAQMHGLGLVPVLSHAGLPQVRLGGFLSLAGTTLAGPWTPASALPDPTA